MSMVGMTTTVGVGVRDGLIPAGARTATMDGRGGLVGMMMDGVPTVTSMLLGLRRPHGCRTESGKVGLDTGHTALARVAALVVKKVKGKMSKDEAVGVQARRFLSRSSVEMGLGVNWVDRLAAICDELKLG